MVSQEENVITTVKLTKVFRDFWLREKVTAVNELDLQVARNEIFGLLGPNGCGKSTTLKMILGLLFPTKGLISVLGRGPTDVRTKNRIGFLPEESYMYPFLDARETLDFYGRLYQIPRRQRVARIDMLLEMVGLEAVAARRIGEYSKGMQRRVGLAQALINDPDLLILDEPTSGMDPLGIAQFKELLRTLASRGKTIILSSHMLADAEDVCDRVCIMYGGKIMANGKTNELLRNAGQTQITSDQLSPDAIRKIEKIIADEGKELLSVAAPSDRLEKLFLKIITDARSQKVATGGATSGGQVADFLRGDQQADGKQLVENLVAAAVSPAPEQKTESPAASVKAGGVDENLLDSLRSQAAAPVEKIEPDKSPATKNPPDADRGVIDELLGGKSADGDKK